MSLSNIFIYLLNLLLLRYWIFKFNINFKINSLLGSYILLWYYYSYLVYYSDQMAHNFTNHKERNDACFGVSLDTIVKEDFDFEKNLALFNKKDFCNKILKKPDLVSHEKVSTKYKHNENVLHSTPVKFRQVTVPSPAINEYITGISNVYIICS